MAKTNTLPKWATPDRRNLLASILTEYLAVNGWKLDLRTSELYHPDYEARIEPLIADWKQQDRRDRLAELQAERRELHSLGERRYPVKGRFNAISREIYHDTQPLYYLQGQAVSGLTLKPFVKVRIASSYVTLFIDLGDALREVSKSRRRKAVKYGKPLPVEAERIIRRKCLEAVRDYLAFGS